MPSARFEPAVQASERSKSHALDRAAIGIGNVCVYILIFTTRTHKKLLSYIKRYIITALQRRCVIFKDKASDVNKNRN